MEQTINLFSKGLQLDTNPMVQSNDTLSDALNATFITQNGNEVILLNDMGNRRVDNAYLPAGYEPVGMKEYGGIIYIAAYNPITGKSQIGSFPSPERRLSEMDDINLEAKEINYEIENFPYLTKSYENSYVLGYKFEDSKYRDTFTTGDSLMFPLTGKNTLHAGDKFTVYGNIYNADDISNYHNIAEIQKDGVIVRRMVETPKNRLFTLSLGILNSQNEFVDITKSLVRWEENAEGKWEIHKFEGTDTDLYKFNYLYYIPELFNNFNLVESINDSNFIRERLKIAANTYAYKLVGPLYIKASLNHFLKFSYNITGYKNENNETFNLQITGIFTYNCPDGIIEDNLGIPADDNYYNYYIGNITDIRNNKGWFTLNNLDLSSDLNLKINIIGETLYNPETNLYTAKVTKTYNNIEIPLDSHLYKYYLNVYNNNHSHVIRNGWFSDGLSDEGVIDLDKLGSGDVELKEWRFLTNIEHEITYIAYGFYAYSKFENEYTRLKIKFKDIQREDWTLELELEFQNKNTIEIPWNKFGLEERHLYVAELTVSSEDGQETKSIYGWILTTELFNECYSKRNSKYVSDYTNPNDKLRKIFDELTTVKCGILFEKLENNGVKYSYLDNSQRWLLDSNETFKLKYTHTYNIDLKYSSTPQIINEYLYPYYIKLANLGLVRINEDSIKLSYDFNIEKLNRDKIKVFGNHSYTNEFEKLIELHPENLVIKDGKITGDIIHFSDLFIAEAVNDELMYNIFSNIEGKLEYFIRQNTEHNSSNIIDLSNFEYTFNKTYGGVHIMGLTNEGERNRWLIFIALKHSSEFTGQIESDSDTIRVLRDDYTVQCIDYRRENDPPTIYDDASLTDIIYIPTVFSMNDQIIKEDSQYILSTVYEAFNDFMREEINSGGLFLYMFRKLENPTMGNQYKVWHLQAENVNDKKELSKVLTKNRNETESKFISSDGLINYGDDTSVSRVWWKNTEEKWVLLNGTYNRLYTIGKFLSKTLFNTDGFIYCYRNNLYPKDIRKYMPSGSMNCYNKNYTVENEKMYLSYLLENIQFVFNALELLNLINALKTLLKINYIPVFIYPDNASSVLDIDVNFESSKKLYNYFSTYTGLKNIYINYVDNSILSFILDNKGNEFDREFIYLEDLVKDTSTKYYSIRPSMVNELLYNTVYCNINNLYSIPNSDYRLGDTKKNSSIAVFYDGIPTVGNYIINLYNKIHISGDGFNGDSQRVDDDISHVGNRR